MTMQYHVQVLGGILIENGTAGKTGLAVELLDWVRRLGITAARTHRYAISAAAYVPHGQPCGIVRSP